MELLNYIDKKFGKTNSRIMVFMVLVVLLSVLLAWYMLSHHYPAVPADASREERDRD